MITTLSALTLCFLLCGLGIFQLLLALGKPYGEYAWGGEYTVLPTRLRIASAVSILLYAFFVTIVADAMGWIAIPLGPAWMKALAIYLSFGILLNGISRSKKERSIMTPMVSVTALCAWIIVL